MVAPFEARLLDAVRTAPLIAALPDASRVLHRLSDRLHNNVNSVAGVFAYLLSNGRRDLIRRRLRSALSDLIRQGHEIVLVSESMGTVIAFDVLRAEPSASRSRPGSQLAAPCA